MAVLALAGDLQARTGRYLLLHFIAFSAFLAALLLGRSLPRGRAGFLTVLVVAAALRGLLLPSEPTLSDDIYRYVWDGRVAAAGINPYRLAPDDPDLSELRNPDWEKIHHKEVPTIYPPLMQGVFLAVTTVSPSVMAVKATIVLFDLLLILILAKLVSLAGGEPWRLAIYAWNPLVVVEVAGSGHNEVIAVLLLLGALLAIVQGRHRLSMTALGASILAKLLPLVALPIFLRRTRGTNLWPLPLLLAAGYLVFAGSGVEPFRGLSEFGHRWQHNDFLFRGVLNLLLWVEPGEMLDRGVDWIGRVLRGDVLDFLHGYVHPQYLARVIVYALMVGAGIYASFKSWEPSRELLVCLTAVLLLAPVMNPWYLLWVIPLLAIHPSRALILWTGLAPLSYALRPGVGGEPPGGPLLFVEYVPVLLLLAWELRQGRPVGSRGDGGASVIRADPG